MDSISRQALINTFECWLKVPDYNNTERHIIKAALYEVKSAPSVRDEALEELSAAVREILERLRAWELMREAKKPGCTYRPDCPWYDGSKCNSPNDHGYHECDYDRGIFPESTEEGGQKC